jgi:alpha-tubulin suppressor-like RCC1 family protein
VLFAVLSWWLILSGPNRSRLGTGRPLPRGKVNPQLVSAGDRAVLLAPDGSLWGWGGTESKLDGLFEKPTVTQIPLRIGSDSDWWQVAAGYSHTAALKTNGTLWFWGIDSQGQPALPAASGQLLRPTRVGDDTNWVQITAGSAHYLALKNDGSIWAWGENNDGEIGNATTNSQLAPTRIGSESDWARIAAGYVCNSFALKSNGTLWVWGADLDNTKSSNDLVPRPIDSSSNWVRMAASDFDLLGLKSDGTVWIGGRNARFTGKAYVSAPSRTMTQVGRDKDWKDVYAGRGYFFARKTDDSWWVCGGNAWGELGIGSPTGLLLKSQAKSVEGLPFDFEPWAFALDAGWGNTVLLTKDGTLWTWGMRLGAPNMSARTRKWKMRLARFLQRLPGHPEGFSFQGATVDASPNKLWKLPPEVIQSGKKE